MRRFWKPHTLTCARAHTSSHTVRIAYCARENTHRYCRCYSMSGEQSSRTSNWIPIINCYVCVSDEKYTKCSKLPYHKYEKKFNTIYFFLALSLCESATASSSSTWQPITCSLVCWIVQPGVSLARLALSPCRCTTRPSDFIIPFQSSIDFVVPCARIDFHLSFFNAWLYILISFERALSAAATVSSVWPSFDFMETLTIRQNWVDTSILLLYREHKSCM